MTSIVEQLAGMGAVLTGGHYVYASGKHGPAYVNKRAVLVHPGWLVNLCGQMAMHIKERDAGIDAVVAPAVGAIALGTLVASIMVKDHLGIKLFIAEKDGQGGFAIKTEPQLLQGKRVVIVEDILTTGGSAMRVAEVVRELGAEVGVVAAIVNRGGVTAEGLGVSHLVSLVNVTMDMYDPEECPLCKAGTPVNTDFGHGAAFLAGQAQ